MTPEQNNCLEEARNILKEHFDSFVIATRATDENHKDELNTDWHGPISDALGLATVAAARIESFAVRGRIE